MKTYPDELGIILSFGACGTVGKRYDFTGASLIERMLQVHAVDDNDGPVVADIVLSSSEVLGRVSPE